MLSENTPSPPNPEFDERTLVSRARLGDRNAFSDLVQSRFFLLFIENAFRYTTTSMGKAVMNQFGRWLGKIGRNALTIAVIALPVFPASVSVLCIAPGGHMEVENINAPCCASPVLADPARHQSDYGIEAASHCGNCTDLFMTACEYGSLSKAQKSAGHLLYRELLKEYCAGNDNDFPSHMGETRELKTGFISSAPLRC